MRYMSRASLLNSQLNDKHCAVYRPHFLAYLYFYDENKSRSPCSSQGVNLQLREGSQARLENPMICQQVVDC